MIRRKTQNFMTRSLNHVSNHCRLIPIAAAVRERVSDNGMHMPALLSSINSKTSLRMSLDWELRDLEDCCLKLSIDGESMNSGLTMVEKNCKLWMYRSKLN